MTLDLRHTIERLGPYQSLVLLAVPTSLIEPLKLAALTVAGKGHWITGTAMVLAAYAGSLLVVERLFRIVRPKLLTLSWFARIWVRFVALRRMIGRLFRHWRGRVAEDGVGAGIQKVHETATHPEQAWQRSRKSPDRGPERNRPADLSDGRLSTEEKQ